MQDAVHMQRRLTKSFLCDIGTTTTRARRRQLRPPNPISFILGPRTYTILRKSNSPLGFPFRPICLTLYHAASLPACLKQFPNAQALSVPECWNVTMEPNSSGIANLPEAYLRQEMLECCFVLRSVHRNTEPNTLGEKVTWNENDLTREDEAQVAHARSCLWVVEVFATIAVNVIWSDVWQRTY